MSKLKIELNTEGVKALLKSPEMQKVVDEHAKAIQGRCGNGYEKDVFVGKNRCNAMVWAETVKAKQDNRRNNTILKAVR